VRRHLLRRQTAVSAVLAIALGASVAPAASAGGASTPSIRLVTAQSSITAYRYGNRAAYVDSGIYVAAVDGAFQLNASRPDYDTPIALTQVDATDGSLVQTLPADLLSSTWLGLTDFIHVTVRNENGHLVHRDAYDWCPNAGERQRIDDGGPLVPQYPFFCGGMPLTLGMVWGIDQGWAASPFGYRGATIRGPDGVYTLTARIRPTYRALFGISDADAVSTITVTLQTVGHGRAQGPNTSDAPRLSADVPIDTNPDPSTIPDLRALPAWGIGGYHRHGRDYVTFGTTEWNDGPKQLTVEGFRQPDATTMDAFQYFFDDTGAAVGKAPVGTMEFDTRPGHHHWHFEQFANYALLDATQTQVVASHKQSFCLAPTDPVDLTQPGAEMDPYQVGLSSQCGSQSALWVREDLPAGWGDTYFQFVRGQAFNITDLPNGRYFIRVTVNPLGSVYETDTTNDTSLRRVLLKGRPGHRRIVVPLYHGIDTEHWCSYCGGGF
jgi:hypothetical protein